MLLLLASPAVAQRVQFPSTAQSYPSSNPYTVPSADPYSVPGTTPPPPPTFGTPSPYTVTPPPASSQPIPAAPSYASPSPYAVPQAPTVSPPPSFDPYASGNPMGPPPASVPYTSSPAVMAPPPTDFPQQPGALYPNGLPYSWQPGTPAFPGEESYWTKTQRFLQELSAEYTYLYGKPSNPNDLQLNRLELSSSFAVPMFYNVETPLLITPGFAFNWFNGPPPPQDLPSQIYDAYLDFAYYPRWSPWLGAELGFRTGVYSDFNHVTTDSVRFLGRGLASISLTPTLDILFGAVYLDRLKIKILPAGGVYWRPTPEWDAYLVFPNPKVRKHWFDWGNSNIFWYVAGEYGGGSWTIQQQAASAQIDYNDIRTYGGLEFDTQTKIRGYFEVGYVFDREVLYKETVPPGTFNPNDTFMLRAGIDF
jgi:Domain of unknown function (DUF6268)